MKLSEPAPATTRDTFGQAFTGQHKSQTFLTVEFEVLLCKIRSRRGTVVAQ